jgi:hypothetical protein
MKSFLIYSVLLAVVALSGVCAQTIRAQVLTPARAEDIAGRWQVRFIFPTVGEKNLLLDSRVKGNASILLLDSGSDNKGATESLPATISVPSVGRLNFSCEAELPYGTCCREIGTLIFKGKFSSSKLISGTVIFIGSTQEEESPLGFRSMIGTFVATRMRTEK